MSGTHYFRPESAVEADIIVMHDVDRSSHILNVVMTRNESSDGFPPSKTSGDLYTLLIDAPLTGFSDKPHFCVIEQYQCGDHGRKPGFVEEGIGRTVHARHVAPYGCGENHWDGSHVHTYPHIPYGEGSASWGEIIELKSDLISYLRNYNNGSLIKVYSLLLVPDDLSLLIYADREYHITPELERFIVDFRQVPDPQVKAAIKQVAAKALRHLGTARPERYAFLQAILHA